MAAMEGSLSKWTNVMKGWQYRWFVLDEDAGLLSYYTSKEKMMRGVRRGCVRLKSAIIGIDDEDDSTFTITVDHKTFHFQARDGDEREKWVRALEDTILRHNNRELWERQPHALKDFDGKVAEADAYLQIMIEQINNLEKKLDTLVLFDEKAKCGVILQHAQAMLDNIKHSIVLLQIAKNTAHPINGLYRGPPSSGKMDTSGSLSGADDDCMSELMVQSGIAFGDECKEPRPQTHRNTNIRAQSVHTISGASSNAITLLVPETSYSSSEGEEDYYDANDDPYVAATSTNSRALNLPELDGSTDKIGSALTNQGGNVAGAGTSDMPTVKSRRRSTLVDGLAKASSQSNSKTLAAVTPPPITQDGSLDYDALYDEDEDFDSEESMESHGSVMTHLLSQVKIGMDLTKVVLPTFILERRSLLEMYADYFAHPDIFVAISDFKTPQDRMVQVIKWYLSSYHAGRKSAVAKKPYNPVLGEIFRCHWDIPGDEVNKGSDEKAIGGPVPWCTNNQLTFMAEQVSHHPPISAFYAELPAKNISFCAHIWTKSKFLGLSIGVHNIGEGRVQVLDYGEEYVLTFPNGYGRSILTTPWIELGGPVMITCAKTGYHADIEFLTKPFYGGKKHRLSAEVYAAGDRKKPFLTINGEWNGVMEAKWSDGKQETFVDVNQLTVVKKRVRPIAEQDANESRRLWKEVTAGLRLNDIERATNAKCLIEQEQRELVTQRRQDGRKWDTKAFTKFGEGWIFETPLQTRRFAD